MIRSTSHLNSSNASFKTLTLLSGANRSILITVIAAGLFFPVFTGLGVSEGLALLMSALCTLIAFQLVLKGAVTSPASVVRQARGVNVPMGLGLAALAFLIGNGIANFLGVFIPELSKILEVAAFSAASPVDMAFLVLATALIVPFYEELVFRGLALEAYSGLRSPLYAALFTSLLFALAHGSLVQALAIFPFGFLMAMAMLKTGQLWTVVLAHGLSNLVGVSLMQFDDLVWFPSTPIFGIAALALAGFSFWLGVRWLGPPAKNQPGSELEAKSIWTPSLIVAVTIMLFIVVFTTLAAYLPSLGMVS